MRRTDFDELRSIVRDLAEAQKRTEQRIEELAEAQKTLAEAQTRTAEGLEQLRQSFSARLGDMEEELAQFRRTFDMRPGGLGVRWGIQTEEAFREGLRAILQEVGLITEQFLDIDTTGAVFGVPDQVELDVVINNGKVVVVEIKSSLSQGDVYLSARWISIHGKRDGGSIGSW